MVSSDGQRVNKKVTRAETRMIEGPITDATPRVAARFDLPIPHL
jgi:hypothetical protein